MSHDLSAPSRARSARADAAAMLHRYPVTAIVAAVTVAVSVPALALPGLVRALEQVPQAIWRGQWWRLVSPVFVQGYGLRQFAFNLLGIVLAGAAVERHYGRWRWLGVYLVAGVAGIVLTSWWFPHQTDSGSSAAVAGLIGALVVHQVATRSPLPWPVLLYSIFFAVYLTGEGFGESTAVAAVAGAVGTAAVLGLRVAGYHDALRVVTAVVVVAGAVAMLTIGDVHGVGLAAGMIVAALLRPSWPRPGAGLRDRPEGPPGDPDRAAAG